MKVLVAAVALVGSATTGSAMADGNLLLKACQSVISYYDNPGAKVDPVGAAYCMGAMNSTTSLIGITNPAMPANGRVCLPPTDISGGQMARIVVRWMSMNPKFVNQQQMNVGDGNYILAALSNEFPCK